MSKEISLEKLVMASQWHCLHHSLRPWPLWFYSGRQESTTSCKRLADTTHSQWTAIFVVSCTWPTGFMASHWMTAWLLGGSDIARTLFPGDGWAVERFLVGLPFWWLMILSPAPTEKEKDVGRQWERNGQTEEEAVVNREETGEGKKERVREETEW